MDTLGNRAVVQQIWGATPNRSHLEGVTIFKFLEGSSPEDTLINELGVIDLHHGIHSANPPYTIIEIIGTTLTDRIRDELAEYGFDQFDSLPQGFRAIRPLPNGRSI